jgi:hypothetical protein
MKKKSTKTTKVPDTVNITIIKESHQTITRHSDPDEKWDGNDTETDTEIKGFQAGTTYFDFVVKKPVKDTYYLVCVYYDTGDSFHRDDNVMEMVSLVESHADAMAIKNAIDKDDKNEKKEFNTLKVKLPVAGTIEDVHTSTWKGYFEHYRCCEVNMVSTFCPCEA